MGNVIQKPPGYLKAPGKRLWRDVTAQFALEPFHLHILAGACQAADRMEEARSILDADGLVVLDAKGTARPHPCVSVERDSRTAMLRALRELALDAAADEVRPPRIVGRY